MKFKSNFCWRLCGLSCRAHNCCSARITLRPPCAYIAKLQKMLMTKLCSEKSPIIIYYSYIITLLSARYHDIFEFPHFCSATIIWGETLTLKMIMVGIRAQCYLQAQYVNHLHYTFNEFNIVYCASLKLLTSIEHCMQCVSIVNSVYYMCFILWLIIVVMSYITTIMILLLIEPLNLIMRPSTTNHPYVKTYHI